MAGTARRRSALPPPLRLQAPPGVPRRLPTHPGRFLARHYLEPLGWSQTDAARRLGISRQRLNELVQGHRAMTPDTAIRCALAFGLPASTWLQLQAQWDSFVVWKALCRADGGVARQPTRLRASACSDHPVTPALLPAATAV